MTMTLRYFRVTFYHQDFHITTTIDNLNMSTVDENTDVTTAQATHDIRYVASIKLRDSLPFIVGTTTAYAAWFIERARAITIDELKGDGTTNWVKTEVVA
jgi:hypothetical protein